MTWQTEFENSLKRLSKNSQAAHLQDIRVFIRWWGSAYGEFFSPEKLTNNAFYNFRHYEIHDRQVKAATWNRRRSSLMRFEKFLHEFGYVDPSVQLMADVEMKPVQDSAPRWLTAQEVQRIFDQADREINAAKTPAKKRLAIRDRAALAFMFYAGLRVGEVANIEKKHITLSERKGAVLILTSKREKEREVPLNKKARRLISAWLEICETEQVFTVSERNLQLRVSQIGQAARIENVTPHRFRHAFCHETSKKHGIGIAGELAGHEDTRTTKRYTTPGWDELEDAVEDL